MVYMCGEISENLTSIQSANNCSPVSVRGVNEYMHVLHFCSWSDFVCVCVCVTLTY